MSAQIIQFRPRPKLEPKVEAKPEPRLWDSVMGNPWMAMALMPMLISEAVTRYDLGLPSQEAEDALLDLLTGRRS